MTDAPAATVERPHSNALDVHGRIAAVVTLVAALAGGILVLGLIADALHAASAPGLLRLGCGALLAVPLARNVAVATQHPARGVRLLASALTLIVIAVYAVALLRGRAS